MDNTLRRIVASVFKLTHAQETKLTESDSIHTIANWDSLGHIKLILALEKEYQVRIPDLEAIKLINLQRIVDFLGQRDNLSVRTSST